MSTSLAATATDEACAPAAIGPSLTADAAERLAARLKALADPSRLRMLSLVAAAGDACVCDLAAVVDVSQPTVSHHLKVLRDAGVVTAERRGTWVHYQVAEDAADLVRTVLAGTGPALRSAPDTRTAPTERTPR